MRPAMLLLLAVSGVRGLAEIRILTPAPDAAVPSSFVVLTATVPAGTCWLAELDGAPVAKPCADAAGRLHQIIHAVNGRHEIGLRALDHPAARVSVHAATADPGIAAGVSVDWQALQEADIILAHTNLPEQTELFDPVYTHAALYLGPAPSGAPLLVEAVRPELAEGLGEVRALPLERSGLFRTPGQAQIFRLAQTLRPEQREAIVDFARRLASRGSRYRSSASFADLYTAWLLWDPRTDRPRNRERFEEALARLRQQKESLASFDCATLVWHAYWEGTDRQVDLGEPNRVVLGGQLAGKLSAAFLTKIRPYFLSVDSLYRSGKLVEVSAR